MCGICGIWYFNSNRAVEMGVLERMTASLMHRGPDDLGYYREGSVGLGFRRLSLIDRATGQQPIANENQLLWLVCNGEIYNYQALRLQLHRHCFQTNGDVETILHLYEEHGHGCLDALCGMFAFALWDKPAQEMMLAVDRFGEKPLYYALDTEKLIFGSELKALVAYLGQAPILDHEAVDEYFASGCIGAPRTIYRGISKMSPGQVMTVRRDGTAQLRYYWQPRFVEPDQWDRRSPVELASELNELLMEAVRLRMVSDEPIGAFLSGGIDSSSVLALMSRFSAKPVKTFSIGFDNPAYDEHPYAQAMADYCGAELIHEVISPSALGVLPDLVRQFDEPFADSSMIPTYYVSRLARQQVKAVLSGDGGDEVFAGYSHYLYAYRQLKLQALIPPRFRPRAANVAWLLPRASKIKPYLAVVDQGAQYWKAKTAFFNPEQRRLLYGGGRVDGGNERRLTENFQGTARLDGLSQMQHYDLRTYLPNDILVKVDRVSMFASLEVRAPLLDHRLFEFMARTPPYHRVNVFSGKLLLKRALGRRLPAIIRERRKQGFSIPQAEWLRQSSLVRDILPGSSISPVLDHVYIRQLWSAHAAGQADHSDRLWAVLCFLLWMA